MSSSTATHRVDLANASSNEEHEPAWMSTDYDAKHRAETAPLLFGTGKLSLQDPEGGAASGFPLPLHDPADAEAVKDNDNDHSSKDEHGDSDDDSDDNDEEGDNGDRKGKGKTSKKKQSGTSGYGSVVSAWTRWSRGSDDSQTSRQKKKKTTALKDSDILTIVDGPDRSVQQLRPHLPRQNPCLWLFHLLQGITVTSSLCLLTTQILPLVLISAHDIPNKFGVSSLALRAYISLFCILFILTEADVPVPLVQHSNLLQRYASRGFLYSFLGLVCVEQSYSERVKQIVETGGDEKNLAHVEWAAIFMQLSSWVMLGIGILYLLMGVCCLKRLRDKLKQQERDAWTKYRQAMKVWKEMHT